MMDFVWNPAGIDDPRNQLALDELRDMVRVRYPEATFEVTEGFDPPGLYLEVRVDMEDTGEVFDVVVDRLRDIQVEEQLPVYVVTLPTPERAAAIWAEQLAKKKAVAS